jgi:hypothetical protein
MSKSEYLDSLVKKSKDISRKIKKLKLYELRYFTEIDFVKCEKNNNIFIYLKNKYPFVNIYIGYIKIYEYDVVFTKLYIYSNIDIRIYSIIKSAFYIKIDDYFY